MTFVERERQRARALARVVERERRRLAALPEEERAVLDAKRLVVVAALQKGRS